jgi:hypothetical protein
VRHYRFYAQIHPFRPTGVFKLKVFAFLGIIRTILAISLSFALAFAPVASSFAAPHGSGMEKMRVDAGIGMDGMDCQKSIGGGINSDCKCCDTKSMCPDQAACMTKCGNLLGVVRLPVKIALLVSVRYLRVAPEKPPNCGSSPPSPPPRS